MEKIGRILSKLKPTEFKITLKPLDPLSFLEIVALWKKEPGAPRLTNDDFALWRAAEEQQWFDYQMEALEKKRAVETKKKQIERVKPKGKRVKLL